MTIIYVLLVAHFVADFVCQSDWMAIHKSKRWDALALHVAVYAAVLFVFVHAGAYVEGNNVFEVIVSWPIYWIPHAWRLLEPVDLWVFVGVNAAAHFVQDAITSRITARLWFIRWTTMSTRYPELQGIHCAEVLPTRHWFFVGIGADQLLHYVTLFVTAGWWLK